MKRAFKKHIDQIKMSLCSWFLYEEKSQFFFSYLLYIYILCRKRVNMLGSQKDKQSKETYIGVFLGSLF